MTTLAVLVTATVISVMSNSMVTVLLPLIGQDFAASAAALGWTATAFLLSFGLAALFHGRLSDLFGVRGVFGVGLLLFGLGSLLAGLATCMPMLIIARVVQGLGGAAVPALSAVMVTRMLPAGRRGLAFGLIATGTGFAQAAGPVLGGLIGQLAGWRAHSICSPTWPSRCSFPCWSPRSTGSTPLRPAWFCCPVRLPPY